MSFIFDFQWKRRIVEDSATNHDIAGFRKSGKDVVDIGRGTDVAVVNDRMSQLL